MTRRLFVAIELPAPLGERIGHAVDRAAAAELPAARWVRAEGLHCTLRFLGAQPDTVAETLPARMAGLVAAHPAMELTLGALGAFPERGKARVLWLGLSRPAALGALAEGLSGWLESELGLAREGRPFHPHVTVARCRGPWPREAVRSGAEHFEALAGERFRVGHVTLFESELGAGGARYHPLAEVELGAAAPSARGALSGAGSPA